MHYFFYTIYVTICVNLYSEDRVIPLLNHSHYDQQLRYLRFKALFTRAHNLKNRLDTFSRGITYFYI